MGKKIECDDSEILKASICCNSATSAAAFLGIQYNTYRKHATRLGVFKKNQSGKGTKKPITDHRKISLSEILAGEHPQYQTNKLRKRLFEENIKKKKCECCGITDWLNKPAPLELDHKDGNKNNHRLNNLRILCPNCHAQTETYRGKNTKFKRGRGETGDTQRA